MANLLVVRSNYGEYSPHFINGGYVGIGWLTKIDLSRIKSKDELYPIYQEFQEEDNSSIIGQNVGQIYRFLFDIHVGDYVITQSNNPSSFHYGIVEGEYYYEPDSKDNCPFPHRKKTKWIAEVPRNKFSESFQNSLKAHLTVYNISESEEFFSVLGLTEFIIDITPSIGTLEAENIWAIDLNNSEFRKWSEIGKYTSLMVDLKELEISNFPTQIDIAIALAKTRPHLKNSEIQKTASGIYYFSKLKSGDIILGIAGKNLIQKAGQVVDSNFRKGFDKKFEIGIDWMDEIKPMAASEDIFDLKKEIHKVNSRMLTSLKFSMKTDIEESEKKIAERKSKTILNFELNLSSSEKELSREDGGKKVVLFFGTNRNNTNSLNINERFGDELKDVTYGLCEVGIPKRHKKGEFERPWDFWVYEFKENQEKHIALTDINELSEEKFLEKISDGLKVHREKAALIFIHGFKVTFAEAARKAGQLTHDIHFKGISGFFSWPSRGLIFDYSRDGARSASSVADLQKFIEKIIANTNIERLHLVAHSMGSKLLSYTLKNLSNSTMLAQKLKVINQIVFGAADIDQGEFKKEIFPDLQKIGRRKTSYASDKDKALHLSEDIRRGLPRLGEAGETLFVENGLDTIDASNVKSNWLGHSYIFETYELLSDLHYLLNEGTIPDNRLLHERKKNSLKYWQFPL
ncbi:MAG: alpha/beta hydrolase [Bacteroidetes bacterium]|nr:alpha/beta hydrolase [Bacteroidota bacterium]